MTISTRTAVQQKNNRRFGDIRHSRGSKVATAAYVASGTMLAAYGISRRSWLGAALAATGAALVYQGISGSAKPYSGKVRVGYTIGRPPEDVYNFVREAANWKGFMHGIEMESTDADSFKLIFGKPAGFSVISEAVITDEAPGRFIAWTSKDSKSDAPNSDAPSPDVSGSEPSNSEASPLRHRGVVRFQPAPGGRGTEISVALEFSAPAGQVARAVASFVGWDPEQLVRESLRKLKELLEAGEIASTRGQPVGDRGLKGAALRVLYREASAEDADTSRLAGD